MMLRRPQDSKKNVRNLKLILSYDGTDFAGWQVQPGRTTVQGALASAIGRLSGENVLPQGSGRTDAGVHALEQVASFATASAIPAENWMRALNDISAGFDPGAGGDRGSAGVPRAKVGARQNLSLSHFSWERFVHRFWRGMCGIIRIRWRSRRWLRPLAWLWASTISRRSLRWIRSGWNGWRRKKIATKYQSHRTLIFGRSSHPLGRGKAKN